MKGNLFINGAWKAGGGAAFTSINPASGKEIWKGNSAAAADVDAAMNAARAAFPAWAGKSFDERAAILKKFQSLLDARKDALTLTLSRETGKTLWDAKTEVAAAVGKLSVTLQAWQQRTNDTLGEGQGFKTAIRFRPHGVTAVFGPYNFPLHLPNGHIMPALLAGNCVVFKPSELTPLMAEETMECWQEAGIPPGVISLIQGERETGKALAGHPGIDGLFFTGSSDTGTILHKQFAGLPQKIMALELGGNNPLIVHDVADIKAAVYWTIISAYQTSGQRCTCARRLIVPEGKNGDAFIEVLATAVKTLTVGAYDETPEPFMGPLISNKEADRLLAGQEEFIKAGGKALVTMKRTRENLPFVSPALIDVTAVKDRPDREWFGPLLQIIRVKDFDAAIAEAGKTQYGLSSGIFTDRREYYERFLAHERAGVINWNRPLTGSSATLPFGGVGFSGNHRPAAYFATDYCSYPVASNEAEKVALPPALPPGLTV